MVRPSGAVVSTTVPAALSLHRAESKGGGPSMEIFCGGVLLMALNQPDHYLHLPESGRQVPMAKHLDRIERRRLARR